MEPDWLDRHLSAQTCYATLSTTLLYASLTQLRQLELALGEYYLQQALFLIVIATIAIRQTSF